MQKQFSTMTKNKKIAPVSARAIMVTLGVVSWTAGTISSCSNPARDRNQLMTMVSIVARSETSKLVLI
jgi:hypothetical protein